MTIGEFSELTGISCSALRYYEEKGLIHVERDFGNRRIYSVGILALFNKYNCDK